MDQDIETVDVSEPIAPPVRDEQGLVTIEIGARKVKVKELSGSEARRAETLAMSQTETERTYARVLFAVREMDGTKFDPKTSADLDRVSGRLTANEQDVLLLSYNVAFSDEVLEEQVKKLVDSLKRVSP